MRFFIGRFIRHSVFLSGLSLVCLIVCLIVFSPFVQAQNSTVKKIYESAIFVPWQFLSDSALASQTQNGVTHLSFNLGPVQLEAQEIPINLSNIQVEIDAALKNVGSSSGETLWQAREMATRIQINGFSVEKHEERWINGIKVRIHLSATCSAFELTQPKAQMNMSWGWKSQGTQLEASLSSLELLWNKNSWKVSNIHCQGPTGFGDLVQAEIHKQLAEPEQFIAPIKEYLEKYFNQQITSSLEQYRKPQRIFSDLQTALVMEMTGVEAAVAKGLVLKGVLEVEKLEGSSATHKELVPLDATQTVANLETTSPALIFPGLAAESLIADIAENRVMVYDLNRFEAFRKFLSSKFMQFFVWPDLLNYEEHSVFSVTSKVSGRPAIKYSPEYGMWIQGYVDSWIYSQRAGRNWRYIDLRSGFAAWVTPEVRNGHIKFSFSGQNLNSAARMTNEYVTAFRPRTRLGLSTIEKAIKKAPFFQGFSMELPSIRLKNGVSLKANKLIRSDKDAFIVELVPDSSEGIAGL